MPFECKRCGECCGPVSFTMPMFRRFKDKAQRKIKKIIPGEKTGTIIPIGYTIDCVFLTDKNLCAIHPNRPKVCRQQGRIPELPCPHNEDYKDSPYPAKYDKIIEDARKRSD